MKVDKVIVKTSDFLTIDYLSDGDCFHFLNDSTIYMTTEDEIFVNLSNGMCHQKDDYTNDPIEKLDVELVNIDLTNISVTNIAPAFTGIIRRIDDLGRIVIPKEIRKTIKIKEGSPMEIYVSPSKKEITLRLAEDNI